VRGIYQYTVIQCLAFLPSTARSHCPEDFHGFSVPPHKHWDSATEQAMSSSYHNLPFDTPLIKEDEWVCMWWRKKILILPEIKLWLPYSVSYTTNYIITL